jgi:hypothetical protein
LLNCDQNLSENRLNRKQTIDSNKNEKTLILKNDYQKFKNSSVTNFRYRFLPYIESKNEIIKSDNFMNSYNFLLSYDQNLFNKINNHGFKIIPFLDQYHKVELDLRYNLSNQIGEEYFPTIILMIQHGNVWPGLTSFKGVGLKILLRMSVFEKNGNEIAYCQKNVFDSIFSNDFFENHVINENSPFVSNLNVDFDKFSMSPIFRKILDCKKELNLTP